MALDLWTLFIRRLQCVIGHCIGDTGSLQETVLALHEIKGRHTYCCLSRSVPDYIYRESTDGP